MNTIQKRASRTEDYEIEEDDSYYTKRTPSSAVRYTQPRQQVIQRGNKRIVIHNEPPPQRKLHWSFILGLGMILALCLWIGASYALSWWTNHQLDATFGMPRTYQTDAVIYPGDTLLHPSHYIFLNLGGKIFIVELPHDNATHARIYQCPTLLSDNAGFTPITGEFKTINGRKALIVHIGDQQIMYLNDGTQFKLQV